MKFPSLKKISEEDIDDIPDIFVYGVAGISILSAAWLLSFLFHVVPVFSGADYAWWWFSWLFTNIFIAIFTGTVLWVILMYLVLWAHISLTEKKP